MPETIAMYIATATLTAGSVMTYNAILAWTYVTLFAASAAYGQSRKKSAERKARAAFNASLKDRLEMVDITPDQPRTIALGLVRSVEGVRRKWVSGANDEKLTMIVSLAGHEIDGVIGYYFNDNVIVVDGSGYVTSAPYYKTRTESVQTNIVVTGGSGSTTVAQPPLTGGVVNAALLDGEGNPAAWVVVSVAGSTLSITGAPMDGTYVADYQYTAGTSTARIRPYLGTATQNVGADLAAEYPGKITAADKFAGIALLVVDIDYDPDVYVQGRPNVSALFRGAKVYDPRADSTVAGGAGFQRLATPSTWAWSENPALLAYHYARHANGWAVPAAEIMPAAAVAAEAAQCDLSTVFTLRKSDATTSTVTLPRHQCGVVISTAGDPGLAMDSILETMAGRAGWAGGTWQFRAGRMPASVASMGQGWLARRMQPDGTPEPGPTLVFSNGVPRADKINRVTGVCVDPAQRYQPLPFPAIEDPVLIAAEGATYPLEVEYEGVNHLAHAQHLASIAIRRNQAALRLEAGCNLHAYRCELFDVLSMTLPRYAISNKTMEVVGWRWHPAEGVQLSLSEITDDIYTVQAELVGRDPAPNTSLPSPWSVETLTGLAVTSSAAELLDGSRIVRAQVSWAAAVQSSVKVAGSVLIEVSGLDREWMQYVEAGSATSTVITGLRDNSPYTFRARFVNALGVRGDYGLQVSHLTISLVDTIAPAAPVGLAVNVLPGAIQIVWTKPPEADYLRTQLQVTSFGGSWNESAPVLWQGDATELIIPWPQSGTYKMMARHIDLSGNVSPVSSIEYTIDGLAVGIVDRQWFYATGAVAVWGRQLDETTVEDVPVWGGTGGSMSLDPISEALETARNAELIAKGKISTYYQAQAPGGAAVGDLWFDTDNGLLQYRWTGAVWLESTDDRVGAAISAAAGAQAVADGKVTTFVSGTEPTAESSGDLWINTAAGNALYRWDGTTWTAYAVSTGGIASAAVNDVYEPLVSAAVSGTVSGSNGQFIDGRTITPSVSGMLEVQVTFNVAASGAWDSSVTGRAVIYQTNDVNLPAPSGDYQPLSSSMTTLRTQSPALLSDIRSTYTVNGRFSVTAGVEYRAGFGLFVGSASVTYYACTISITLIKR